MDKRGSIGSVLRLVFGYGALAAAVALCLRLVSLAPLRFDWGRELLAAVIALAGVAVGLWIARNAKRGAEPDDVVAEPNPSELRAPPADIATLLSPRERHVLALLAAGATNKEIARELGVSANTVKTHLANLYAKLGARRRTEAVAAARRTGVIA